MMISGYEPSIGRLPVSDVGDSDESDRSSRDRQEVDGGAMASSSSNTWD